MNTKKAIKISVAIGFAITFLAGAYSKAYADKTQAAIASEVIRFHVLANSDSLSDQALKVKVKDNILARFGEGLKKSENIEETRSFIVANLGEIEDCARETIDEEGFDYPVTANLACVKFPTKVYGDIKLPAGYYDALQVEIGSGNGANWWCVMFPPLCFVDATAKEAPQEVKESLMENLSYEDYRLVSQSEEDTSIKIKFKIVELWQEFNEKEEIILTKNLWNEEKDTNEQRTEDSGL